MKLIRLLFLSGLLLTVIFIAGCSEKTTTSVEPGVTGQQLAKYTLPTNATLVSGTLVIYMYGGNSPEQRTVNVYGNTGDWDEATVNTTNRPGYDILTVNPSFSTDGFAVWKRVNITDLVQKWLNCDPNYGILLNQVEETSGFGIASYSSKEGAYPEYLEIVYSIGGVNQPPVQVPAIADAYLYPRELTGNTSELFTGYVQFENTELEKETLIKFDVGCAPPSGGCTLTPGYWKTHSEFGPAPYDNTWANLPSGASTIFFSPKNTQTYYQVLWTAPAGNSYYQLSFQFIAAGLNFMKGASIPSEVQTAYNTAETLFETYTPGYIKTLKGNNTLRQQFITLAGILGDYNSGITGPGHCDDIEPL